MKYKVGDRFTPKNEGVYGYGEIGEVKEILYSDDKSYKVKWEDGKIYNLSESHIDKYFKQLKPKKNKLEKRVKELEEEKEKVREFTFAISSLLDENELRLKAIEDKIESEGCLWADESGRISDLENYVGYKPSLETFKLGDENQRARPETLSKKVINPKDDHAQTTGKATREWLENYNACSPTPHKHIINPTDNTNSVAVSSGVNPFEGMTEKGIYQSSINPTLGFKEPPNNDEIVEFKTKTLKERLRDLMCYDIDDYTNKGELDLFFCFGTKESNNIIIKTDGLTDNEIVEKVKKIIEILK